MVGIRAEIQDALSIMPQDNGANYKLTLHNSTMPPNHIPWMIIISDDNLDIDTFESYYSDEDDDNEDGRGDKSDEENSDKDCQQQRGGRCIDFQCDCGS